MASVTKYKCEQCGKEVASRCKTHGWILLMASDFTVYSGKDSGKYHKRLFCGAGNYIDFCGIRCLTKYFEKVCFPVEDDHSVCDVAPIPTCKSNCEFISTQGGKFYLRVCSNLSISELKEVPGVERVDESSMLKPPHIYIAVSPLYDPEEVKAYIRGVVRNKAIPHMPKPKKYVIEDVVGIANSFKVYSDLTKECLEEVPGIATVYEYSKSSVGPYMTIYVDKRYGIDEVRAWVEEVINARS